MSEQPVSPEGFLKAGTNYIKNPLGIIGLFIGLIYGVACVVTGLSPNFSEGQRWTLVIFCVAFPVPVLGVFYRLVTTYHRHLYAPSDWRDEKYFFGPQTQQEREEKEESAADLLSAAPAAQLPANARTALQPAPDPAPAAPKPAAPVRLEPEHDDPRALARRSEELAFRWLSRQFSHERLYRDIRIDGPHMVAFDAGVTRPAGKHLVAIEVKSIRNIEVLPRLLREFGGLVDRAMANINSVPEPGTLAFMLVVVTIGLNESMRKDVENSVRHHLNAEGRSVDLRVLAFEDLEFDSRMANGG
jgi:hypothetical protein